MSNQALNQLLASLRVNASVFHNGQYCGTWAVDTSGSKQMTFHVVSYGECYLKFDEDYIVLKKGDAVFFPADARHRVTNVSRDDVPLNQSASIALNEGLEQDGTGLVCGYLGHQNPMFEKLVAQLPESIVVRSGQATASAEIITLMLRESVRSGQSTNLLLNRLSDCLFYLLLRDHVDVSSGVFAALAHPKLSRALDIIHDDTERKLTVDELASESGMSRSAFSTLFKEISGQSPIEYITQWRMTQAYRWLVDEGISTYAAALRCGYESEASFSKAFKRVLGMGPGKARRATLSSS